MYYGEDFIRQSIESIYDVVDKLYIFAADRPWGDITEVTYKGKSHEIPNPIDNSLGVINELIANYHRKISLSSYYQYTPDNQFTNIYNHLVLPNLNPNSKPDIIILMEPDMIWPWKELTNMLTWCENNRFDCICSKQLEYWKTTEHYLPMRSRPGAIFYDMRNRDFLPITGKNGSIRSRKFMDYTLLNMGFCLSERNMFWKHLIGIGMSGKIHDSKPNENWYEDKWLNWDFNKNNRDLEISKGYEHNIPFALANPPIFR